MGTRTIAPESRFVAPIAAGNGGLGQSLTVGARMRPGAQACRTAPGYPEVALQRA
jgi:hypothetical protein